MTFARAKAAVTVAIFLFLPLAAASVKAADSHDADTAAIKKLFADFNDAFNNHQAAAAAACFTTDGDFINIAGITTKGRAAVEQHLAPLFTARLKVAHREVTLREIRFITPDVATVDSDFMMSGITLPNGSIQAPNKGIYDWVVVKQNGRWLIASWHESNLPEAPAAPAR